MLNSKSLEMEKMLSISARDSVLFNAVIKKSWKKGLGFLKKLEQI